MIFLQRIFSVTSPAAPMKIDRARPLFAALVLALPLVAILTTTATASHLTTIHKFNAFFPLSSGDGAYSSGHLVRDKDGALYGTTIGGGGGYEYNDACVNGCGTVFKVAPAPKRPFPWAESIVHPFTGPDGFFPTAIAVAGPNAIYGLASGGTPCEFATTGCGIAFELTSANGTAWQAATIYAFQGCLDGYMPSNIYNSNTPGSLLLDRAGGLIGSIVSGGLHCGYYFPGRGKMFHLAPPGQGAVAWTEAPIHYFDGHDGCNPNGVISAGTALYGTTSLGGPYRAGSVFRLAPSIAKQGGWTTSVLFDKFSDYSDGAAPQANLVMDKAGALYGTTAKGGDTTCKGGCGMVFKLSPPSTHKGPWKYSIIRRFTGGGDGWSPQGSLALGKSGTIYGSTEQGGGNGCSDSGFIGCGTIFKLVPPKHGVGPWSETLLVRFVGPGSGANPLGDLVADAKGRFFGVTRYGGDYRCNCGTVFMLTP